MKLLKKSVISSEFATQKKQQIDEGVLIARKVDSLREKLQGLEKQERDFLSGMETRLRDSTKSLEKQIDQLQSEIKELEEKRAVLLIPLDEKWKEVKEEDKLNQGLKSKIEEGLQRIKDKESRISSNEIKVKQSLSNIKVRERELEMAYARALESEEEGKVLLNTIQIKTIENERECLVKRQELLDREATIAVRERENDILKERNEEDRKEIINIKIQLADRQATLERTIKRNG